MIEILKTNHLNTLVIETNGIGGFLPELFRNQCRIARYPVALRQNHNHKNKSERILETLDPIMGAGFLKCHHHIKHTPLIKEFKNWSPNKKHIHDDGLDALAGAIAAEPVRIRKTSQHNKTKSILV